MALAPTESTSELLARVRDGDDAARSRLIERYLPLLRGWARGRLPQHARDLAETDDLVQVTLLRALGRLEQFEPRREGAFLAYLRTILLNAVREEIRRSGARPTELIDEDFADPSADARDVGWETLLSYEAALADLPELQREAVVLRVEFGFSYLEISAALESPSADAARMQVKRGIERLASTMQERVGS